MTLSDWASVFTILASICTPIGVFCVVWQVREGRAIAQAQFEDSLDQQYRNLAYAIPVDALFGKEVEKEKAVETREQIYIYFDLSNDQAHYRNVGRIRRETWSGWAAGIKANLEKVEFQKVWKEVINSDPDHFSYISRLIEEGFDTDPKDWN